MSDHATLSPSAAHRWMACPGSVPLIATQSDEVRNRTTPYAEEGTKAHALLEHMLTHSGDVPEHGYDDEEMIDYVRQVCDYVWDTCRGRACELWFEERVVVFDDVWGTADIIIWCEDDRTLETVDFKYGKGVAVDVSGNEQLRIYAIGAAKHLKLAPGRFILTIAQPRVRPEPVSETLTLAELHQWFADVLKPARAAVHAGSTTRVPGVKTCQWCTAVTICPEFEALARETAVEEFAVSEPPDLDGLADKLALTDVVETWIKAVRAEAERQVFRLGNTLPGYKVVEGRSNRKWIDEDRTARALLEAGLSDEQVWSRKVIGITDAEKMLRKIDKAVASNLLSEYAVKPPGKLTLVPVADSRQAVDVTPQSAADDFGVEEE